MDQSLYLAREVLDGDAESLRRVLVDHTRCERTATDLLVKLDRARRDREVSYCVLWPRPADVSDPDASWRIHFGYEAAATV